MRRTLRWAAGTTGLRWQGAGRHKALLSGRVTLKGPIGQDSCLGDICRYNRNAGRALQHHRDALDIAVSNHLAVSERARSQGGQGMDLVLLGRDSEARKVLEETVRVSRQWGLKASLVPTLFYLGWLHAKEGREHDAAGCLGEALRIADEHDHIHFFTQEARVAIPIFALCDRFGVGPFLRDKIVPLLPARLAEYSRSSGRGRCLPDRLLSGRTQEAQGAVRAAGGSGRRATEWPGGFCPREHTHRPGARDPEGHRGGNAQQGDRCAPLHIGEDGEDARQPHIPQAGGQQPSSGHPGLSGPHARCGGRHGSAESLEIERAAPPRP